MNKTTKRYAIFVYWDPEGELRDFAAYYIKQLTSFFEHVLVVVNGTINEDGIYMIKKLGADVLVRSNSGYDFAAYRDGILYFFNSNCCHQCNELLLCNSSCYGPLYDFELIFQQMRSSAFDFWGISSWKMAGIDLHLQSYFILFRKRLLFSKVFFEYWRDLVIPQNREEAIKLCEIKLTDFFYSNGFKWASFVPFSEKEPSIINAYENLFHGMPFIKRKFFTYPELNLTLKRKTLDFINSRTNYDSELILKDFFLNACLDIYKSKGIKRRFKFLLNQRFPCCYQFMKKIYYLLR